MGWVFVLAIACVVVSGLMDAGIVVREDEKSAGSRSALCRVWVTAFLPWLGVAVFLGAAAWFFSARLG